MDDDAVREAAGKMRGPSDEAILKMEDFGEDLYGNTPRETDDLILRCSYNN